MDMGGPTPSSGWKLNTNAIFQLVTATVFFVVEYKMHRERRPQVMSCPCSGALAARSPCYSSYFGVFRRLFSMLTQGMLAIYRARSDPKHRLIVVGTKCPVNAGPRSRRAPFWLCNCYLFSVYTRMPWVCRVQHVVCVGRCLSPGYSSCFAFPVEYDMSCTWGIARPLK